MNDHQDQHSHLPDTPPMLTSITEPREAALIALLAAIILRTCVQDVVESSAQCLTERTVNVA
jgi:hypothetical protein